MWATEALLFLVAWALFRATTPELKLSLLIFFIIFIIYLIQNINLNM
jgi:hypothetical protein